MKKIVLVTSNKRLIELVTFALCEKVNMDIQLLSVTRYGYALQDIKDFAPDLVVIDATDYVNNIRIIELCREIAAVEGRKYKCIMIIDEDKKVRGSVEKIKQEKIIDDFVLMGGSLDYLLNKLSEL